MPSGAAGIGVAAATMFGVSLRAVDAVAAIGPTNAAILNLALNLEYLEAEFYAMASYVATLQQLSSPPVKKAARQPAGMRLPDFGSSPLAFLGTGLRIDEINHVPFLATRLASVDEIGFLLVEYGKNRTLCDSSLDVTQLLADFRLPRQANRHLWSQADYGVYSGKFVKESQRAQNLNYRGL